MSFVVPPLGGDILFLVKLQVRCTGHNLSWLTPTENWLRMPYSYTVALVHKGSRELSAGIQQVQQH